jgi:ribosome-associated translation inhibitor RaiA
MKERIDMQVLIRDRGVELQEDTQERIERSIGFALDRFGPRIKRVTVGLTDLNGPRGGVDKRCRVEVALEPTGTVLIHEDSPDLVAAVDLAAQRVGTAIARKLERDRAVKSRAAR